VGALSAGQAGTGADIVVTAAGTAAIEGTISASGDYRVAGATVTLGGAAAGAQQQAGGSVAIRATAGNVAGEPNFVLQSNADGIGNEGLSLVADTGIVEFATTSSLLGGRAAKLRTSLSAELRSR
jgi:hypothetical protein